MYKRQDFAYAWSAKPYQDLASLLREARNAEDGIAGWSPVARIGWPVVELVEVDPAEVTPSNLALLNYFKERHCPQGREGQVPSSLGQGKVEDRGR